MNEDIYRTSGASFTSYFFHSEELVAPYSYSSVRRLLGTNVHQQPIDY